MYVAETNEKKLVGYLIMKIDDTTRTKTNTTVQITNLIVTPGYRRMKVGTQLVKQAMNAAMEIYDATTIRTKVQDKSSPTCKFLESLGFIVVEERRGICLVDKKLNLNDALDQDDVVIQNQKVWRSKLKN